MAESSVNELGDRLSRIGISQEDHADFEAYLLGTIGGRSITHLWDQILQLIPSLASTSSGEITSTFSTIKALMQIAASLARSEDVGKVPDCLGKAIGDFKNQYPLCDNIRLIKLLEKKELETCPPTAWVKRTFPILTSSNSLADAAFANVSASTPPYRYSSGSGQRVSCVPYVWMQLLMGIQS
jgi:hypothetical protein